MVKLYLDPVHGGSDPGAGGNGIKDKDIVLDIALRIRLILMNDYENVEVWMSRISDTSKSLSQRTNEAISWGANYYLSIHCTTSNGAAQGYEDYFNSSLTDSFPKATYQNMIHVEVMKVNQLQDRGKIKENDHVLRETAVPALLTENRFSDNLHDSAIMKDSSRRQKVAQGFVNKLAKAFNLKSIPTGDTGTDYRVIAGIFKSIENAKDRVTYLRLSSIESFFYTVTVSGETWYRVQAGAFSSRENAEKRLAEIINAGINDTYIADKNDNSNQNGVSGYSLMGKTFLSPEHMNQFVKQINPNAIELGYYYLTFGEYYGIRGDIAFAQALHETNYLRFTGVVKPEQNNFCGLGATGPDNPGASFDTPSDGVLAHLQHLFAYASSKPLPDKYPLVDPRFYLVNRDSASTWVALNGKWAVPGDGYGQSILNLYETMIKATMKNLEEILQKFKS